MGFITCAVLLQDAAKKRVRQDVFKNWRDLKNHAEEPGSSSPPIVISDDDEEPMPSQKRPRDEGGPSSPPIEISDDDADDVDTNLEKMRNVEKSFEILRTECTRVLQMIGKGRSDGDEAFYIKHFLEPAIRNLRKSVVKR